MLRRSGRATLQRFVAILRLCIGNRLPLHIQRIIVASGAHRYDVVDNVAGARTARFVCAWAVVETLEGGAGTMAAWFLCAGMRGSAIASLFSNRIKSRLVMEHVFKRKPQPIAICSECRRHGNEIGHRCATVHAAAGCPGVFIAAESPDYWTPCRRCNATGMEIASECNGCAGRGWHYIRDLA